MIPINENYYHEDISLSKRVRSNISASAIEQDEPLFVFKVTMVKMTQHSIRRIFRNWYKNLTEVSLF
jgi:preprotein translocase subunit SecA